MFFVENKPEYTESLFFKIMIVGSLILIFLITNLTNDVKPSTKN